MKKILLVLVAALLVVQVNVFAVDNAISIGESGVVDQANAIADVVTGNCADVDTNGNLHTAAIEAITVSRKESSQDLSSSAMSYTTDFSDKVKVKQILFHAASAISQTVTFTLDSKTGANYDTVLALEELLDEQSYTYIVPNGLVLEDGDELIIGCTNTDTPAITVYVTIVAEDVT